MLSFCVTGWCWMVFHQSHQLRRFPHQAQAHHGLALRRRFVNPNRPLPVSPRDFEGLRVLEYGDPIYTFGPWDGAPIVIEKYKLIFWTIPKVACTEFKKLFRRMQGHSNWQLENSQLPHNPYSNGLRYLYHYTPQEAEFMITHGSWTKAVFVRNPQERLLSAFLDKVEGSHNQSQHYVRRHCCPNHKDANQRNRRNPFLEQQILQCDLFLKEQEQAELQQHSLGESLTGLRSITWSDFVEHITTACRDPHWKPQAKRIPRKLIPYMTFVGHLDTIADDARQLLTQIGAWEDFGAAGWPGGAFLQRNQARHQTKSQALLQVYYQNHSIAQRVQELYAMDYAHPLFHFNQTLPGTELR